MEEETKTPELNQNLITFGKYKNKMLDDVLRDRKYCEWLLEQSWFYESYEYLCNKVKNYDPKIYFIKNDIVNSLEKNFLTDYKYFNLIIPEKLEINLNESDMTCYKFYLKTISNLKKKIEVRIANKDENIFDIKSPAKLLQIFETETKLNRDVFKEFLSAYELPTISMLLDEIKKEGGLCFNGGKSYLIGKKRSLEQEEFWGNLLKQKYGDNIGTQFKYEECFFDFININTNTIFECKLNLKDFNEKQYDKYVLTLEKYNIIYLISNDCVINIDMETIYTTNIKEYVIYICEIPLLKNPSKFDELIMDFDLVEIENLLEVL